MHKVADVKVEQDILRVNKRIASENRELFDRNNVKVFNVMGAIGSGKTCLIERAIDLLKDDYTVATLAGDVVAKFDSDRFSAHGVTSIPISTGKECHLDAHFVEHGMEKLDLENIDIVFIENVGNLICPSDFDLGEHYKIVVVSVSEGDDIVMKHPVIFKISDLTVVNKVDISEYVGASAEKMAEDSLRCGCKRSIMTSCKNGKGIDEWIGFIRKAVEK
ncbi:MAG TPA: hydrogenase nickel incorporation protein HypB [Candidatus Methanofastidiosa archaeon]|nr:hydrogenase nickel incorporation protein HypB [Candidatus Methanofastidiosa archaeon]